MTAQPASADGQGGAPATPLKWPLWGPVGLIGSGPALLVAEQQGAPVVWTAEPEGALATRQCWVVPTGGSIPAFTEHIGSCAGPSGLVWHLYARVQVNPA